jgi:glyoxylase-like metal-dependent hydrolase (beta-lactamase superfamily II)
MLPEGDFEVNAQHANVRGQSRSIRRRSILFLTYFSPPRFLKGGSMRNHLAPVLFATLSLAPLAPAQQAQSHKAEPPKSVRLYVIDCGTLDIPDVSPYGFKKEELASPMMSAPCFLVAHPKGTLMWDTGPVPDSNFKAGGGPGTMRYATSTKPLAVRLAEIGYAPADIKYLALSHFHWDHVGNANLFASATWLVPKSERDIMFMDPPSPRTEPQNFSALKNAKTVFITKDEYDVFGDKTVIIKAAPGHSPGHQVLYLKLAKTGPKNASCTKSRPPNSMRTRRSRPGLRWRRISRKAVRSSGFSTTTFRIRSSRNRRSSTNSSAAPAPDRRDLCRTDTETSAATEDLTHM